MGYKLCFIFSRCLVSITDSIIIHSSLWFHFVIFLLDFVLPTILGIDVRKSLSLFGFVIGYCIIKEKVDYGQLVNCGKTLYAFFIAITRIVKQFLLENSSNKWLIEKLLNVIRTSEFRVKLKFYVMLKYSRSRSSLLKYLTSLLDIFGLLSQNRRKYIKIYFKIILCFIHICFYQVYEKMVLW